MDKQIYNRKASTFILIDRTTGKRTILENIQVLVSQLSDKDRYMIFYKEFFLTMANSGYIEISHVFRLVNDYYIIVIVNE